MMKRWFAGFCVFLATSLVWSVEVQQLGLGFGGSLMCFHIDADETVWCGVDVGGLVKSTDRGASWARVGTQVVNDHVSAIWVHPQNTQHILLGVKGGILKSSDGGASWKSIRNGLPEYNLEESDNFSAPINCFAHDPQNFDIIYAGVGDRRDASKYHYNELGETIFGRGTIYKSADGGDSWINLRNLSADIHEQANVFSICVSSQNSDKVFAATSRGFYRSLNGGGSWDLLTQGLPHFLVTAGAIDPRNDAVVYLTLKTTEAGYGVYKSTDGGDSWQIVNSGIPRQNMNQDLRPFHLIVDHQNSDVVYMGATEAGGVWKTEDGGLSWANMVKGHVRSHGWQSYGNDYFKSYGFAQSPADPDFLIAGEHWAHKTEDGGETWHQVYSDNTSPYVNRGVDFTVCDYVKVSPYQSNSLFMCVYDQGLYRSTDGGNSWENLHAQMRGQNTSSWLVAVTDLEFGATNDVVYCAVELSVYGADAGYVIKKSTNGGRSWSIVLNGKKGEKHHGWGIYHGLAVDPKTPSTLYVVPVNPDNYSVIKSTDAGSTWETAGEALAGNPLIRQIEIDPIHPEILYLLSQHHDEDGALYKSINGGESFDIVNESALIDPRDLAIDPVNSDILYIAESDLDETGGIYQSSDGGRSWNPILTSEVNFPAELQGRLEANQHQFGCTGITVSPENPDVLYAATGTPTGVYRGDFRIGYGLLRSVDGGQSWAPYAEAIAFSRLNHVEVDRQNPHILYAGSGGCGGFKIIGEDTQVEMSALKACRPNQIQLFGNYPNPFNPATCVSYQLARNNWVQLDLFDMLGRHVGCMINELQAAGYHEIKLNGKNLKSGVYACRLISGGQSMTTKINVVK